MAEPVLLCSGLCKSYPEAGGSLAVLKGASLRLDPGELVAVLGPSGSGKSTLLHLLGLMDRPDSGSLRLLGREAATLGESERSLLRNRKLGFVFQFDSLLPELTLLENVALPGLIAGRARRERAESLLARLGLEGAARRFPMELSGGERQRAALARALLHEPVLLLADEPTGSLDALNGQAVLSALRELCADQGAAVLLATHNEAAAAAASRRLRLRGGALEEA